MATVTPRIYTGAFPTISNPIKYALFAASDPLAEVESQTFAAPHPMRAVSFPGLERINYILRIYEMSGGLPIRTLVDDFNFNPDNNELAYKAPEIIICGITPGFDAGASSFVFDGTAGKPDWRTWTPIMQPPGFSPWLEGYNYTWDAVTGTLTMIDGQTFESEFRVLAEFETIVDAGATGGVPTGRMFGEVLEVTTNITLTADDFGKKILINPASTYLKITLPAITSVVQNKTIFFETGVDTGTPYCVEIEASGGATWAFGSAGRTSMFMVANETFTAYRYGASWHVQDAVGNYKTVGEQVASDNDAIYGGIIMQGQALSSTQYKRLYNEYVLQLPAGQVVNYVDWATNPTKWSYVDGFGNFRVPDRRGMHERNADASHVPGVYLPAAVGPHTHLLFGADAPGNDLIDSTSGVSMFNTDGGNLGYRLTKSTGNAIAGISGTNTGTENFVKSYFINRFVKI